MWSIFEQSPLEDETISNAFSYRGLFKIGSENIVENYPYVQASVQNKKMVIAIDKSLVLLEDEMVAKCSFLSFNAQIDVIYVSTSGDLIICCLNNGEVHGIYIKGIPLFNLFIKNDDVHVSGKSFAGIQQLGNQFYLTCTNGSIYILSEIDESIFESKLHISVSENDTCTFDENLFACVTIKRLPVGSTVTNITTAVIIISPIEESNNPVQEDPSLVPQIIAGSKNRLYFKSTSEENTYIVVPEKYGGTKYIFNLEKYVLLLTNSGHLLKVCPFTKMIMMGVGDAADTLLIEEMIIMECNDENIELLILTKPQTDDEERKIRIIEYPSLICSNELDVPFHSWLVDQPKTSVNLYYLNGQNLNHNNIPTEVEMILVSETHPSERFKKLIAKGHLKEAEDFGRQFELCLQPIYEAKAKRVLLDLIHLNDNNEELIAERFNELMELFKKVEGKEFFIKNHIANIQSRKWLAKYLQEILKHLDEETDELYILEINEQLLRLETLSIIDPYECNGDWHKMVYHSNLAKMILHLLKTDIPTACLIWKRHFGSILPHLDEYKLKQLLASIPNNTEAFHILQWLKLYVPTISNTHPHVMPFITDWSIQKTRALQYGDDWPDIGLEFSTKVTDIFEDISFVFSDVRRQHERNIGKLRDLVNALQDLSVLKKRYNLIFTLDNYLQESIDKTALCILQRVQLVNLKSLINDFLYPIYQEKGNSPIQAIRHYITLLVANCNSLSTWVERAVACIEHLHFEDDRMECALLVLQHSPVPWPETVSSLIKLRYSTHPLALKINTEYELQVIKVMKSKYGWPSENSADINLQLFMFRIVKMNLPDMLDDIRILTNAAPELAISANFNCCYHLVCNGRPEIAYEFFKTLNAEKNKNDSNELIEIFADLLENSSFKTDDVSHEKQENLIEFFRSILPYSNGIELERLSYIQNRFTLCQKFRLCIPDVALLVSYEKRLEYFDAAIENIMERSQATMNISRFIITEMGELCSCLQMNTVFGIVRISQRMQCLSLSCALTYAILQTTDCNNENYKDFIDLALILLAQQIITLKQKKNGVKLSAIVVEDFDPLVYPLARQLLVCASLHKTNDIPELIEVIKYISIVNRVYPLNSIESCYNGNEIEINEAICKALDAAEIALADSTINYSSSLNCVSDMKPKKRESISVFDEIDVKPTAQPIKKKFRNEQQFATVFLTRTIHLLLSETKSNNCLFVKLHQLILESGLIIDIEILREEFFNSLEELIKYKYHDIWYVLVQYLLEYQKANPCKIINADFISLQLVRVFGNGIANKDVNFIDLFEQLIADNYHSVLLKKLGDYVKTDIQRMNYLTLSEMYNIHYKEKEHIEEIRINRLKHYYYMEFCKQDPTIKGKFIANLDNIEKLLKEFQNKQLDVHLLEKMSRDFRLDYQQMLVNQILSILAAQELQYEIKTNSFGEDELVILSSSEEIGKLCQPYINEIKNPDILTSKLKEFISEINMYFYELYLCVIDILSFLDAMPKEMNKWISILQFLKHKMITKRRNRPGQLETDMWYQSQSEIGIMPKIARYRFPFKPLIEQPLKDILDNELNVDNCKSWFPLIQMHCILKGTKEISNIIDFYCTTAVKNSISQYKGKNDTETWHLQPTNNAFLKSILRLIEHVHSPSKAFMLLYFVSNYAPDGADQVEASYECYKYALENESHLTEQKYQELALKIKRKYPILKTQHLLYVYGLTEEKLMLLVENPMELIYHLYHHDIIFKSSKIDINVVVKEIAELHDMNLEQIEFHMLQKWLSFTMEPSDGTVVEDTFFEDHNERGVNLNETSNTIENVIRANYILSSWSKNKALQFLVGQMFPTEGSISTSKQLQMYECFSKLNDGSEIFTSKINQNQFIAIKCVHELKQLGYNSSLEKFANCNKIDILKTIWQRDAQNPLSQEILANICLGYNIYLSKIWNGILKRMIKYNMIKQLNTLVDVLSCQPKLLSTDGLTAAWECVLLQPFKNANQTRSFQQEEILHKALFRLQSCPFVHKLNLLEFTEHCIRLNRPHMAAVFLSLCKDENIKKQIKKLMLCNKSDKLYKEIMDLEEAGILSVILNFALKELDM